MARDKNANIANNATKHNCYNTCVGTTEFCNEGLLYLTFQSKHNQEEEADLCFWCQIQLRGTEATYEK